MSELRLLQILLYAFFALMLLTRMRNPNVIP